MSDPERHRISICACCYNHERFLPSFMESVLSQTDSSWELVVVDDCSTDASFELLREYAKGDSRIRVFQNDRNRHMCHSVNRCVSMASGDLVTLMSCDDEMLPEKVSYDLAFFRAQQDIAALYAIPQVISEDGTPGLPLDIAPDFSRAALLRRQLFGRNALSIPGMTLRKSVWDSVGGYNPLLRMTQDHELHIRILKSFEVACSERPTIRYRRHADSLSAMSEDVMNAIVNESVGFLSDHYLAGLPDLGLLDAVVPDCRRFGEPTKDTVPYFLARHALERGQEPEVRAAGLLALYRYLSDPSNRSLVEQLYDFLPKDFMMMSTLPTIGAMKCLSRAEESLRLVENSVSYRLGMLVTWPLRRIYRGLLGHE